MLTLLAGTERPSIADFVFVPRLQWLVSGANDGIDASRAPVRLHVPIERKTHTEGLEVVSASAYYEHILGREAHEHMICLGCDRIIEWLDAELARVVFRNCAEQSFSPARHSLQVFGYCQDCSKTSEAHRALELGEDANLSPDG